MDIIFPTTFHLQQNGSIPNNPDLPVLVYRQVFEERVADKPKKFQHCFEESGWKGIWKNGLYDYHHFHSSSHEALGIAHGSAEIEVGGEGGKKLTLQAGDLIVLPAGTGHRRVSASDNLVVMGAYPAGQEHYDICRNKSDHPKDIFAAIAAVPLPDSDPIYGVDGPLMQEWSRK